MRVEVKICGLNDDAGVAAACTAGAELLGFVVFPPSPRHVAPDVAAGLAAPARGRAAVVALTVDANDATIDEITRELRPDYLQLHGSETPARCAELRRRHGVGVIKAFGIADAVDAERIPPYLGSIDRVLVDAKPPRGATRPGGLGATFDWRLLDGVGREVPLMLSGGLDAGNVGRAIETVRPDAVDVSSGVERAPGEKDPELIAGFVAAVRAAERTARPVEEMKE